MEAVMYDRLKKINIDMIMVFIDILYNKVSKKAVFDLKISNEKLTLDVVVGFILFSVAFMVLLDVVLAIKK